LRDVDRLGLHEVAARSRELIALARAGELGAEQMRDATFTVTNLGMFGVDAFTPIVHLPQSAVLGVGRLVREPVVRRKRVVLGPVGGRRWIARIMVAWGLGSCATLAVRGPWSFYPVRILVGVAEAGFCPGIVLYLTYWFPARERARAMAVFMAANALAGVVG